VVYTWRQLETARKTGKRFSRSEIEAFADDYLGVDVIFWTTEAPWLKNLEIEPN
jgi:hypothetical protein